jgi:hypothetical protein
MYFRDVQLLNSGKHSEDKLKQNRYLMSYWDNVRDQFCLHLADDLELLDISKLNIQFGEFEGEPFTKPDRRGIALFRRNDFIFEDFFALPEDEKEVVSLGYIEDSILSLCKTYSVPTEILDRIQNASKKVRDSGFQHIKTHKKTSKWDKSRKFRAITKLHFKKGGIDAHLEISDKFGDTITSQKIVDSRMWEAVWFDLWKGTWIGNSFVIENRTGGIYVEVPCPLRDAI